MTVATLAASFCILATGLNLVGMAIALVRLRRPARDGGAAAPPVSLVRPVCGLEPFSEETLASGFRLRHPDYELIHCVADADDPVIPLVRRLMAEHPGVASRLLVGDDRISANPKLNNCVKGWGAARHDDVVLADSNVLMPPDYLAQLLAARRPDTGLVCSTPIGSRPDGFAAEIECAFLNTLQARWQYVGESLGLGFAQGKSMLWRRSLLEAHGGIAALGADIAEDAAATKLVRRAGLHVHLVDSPFEQPLGRRRLREVWSRQIRWARLRRVTFPLFFAPEIAAGAALPALAGAVAAGPDLWEALLAGGGVLALWYGAEALLARAKGWHLGWRTPLACLARDLLVPPLWTCAWIARRVVWRGNAMSIGPGGSSRLEPGLSHV